MTDQAAPGGSQDPRLAFDLLRAAVVAEGKGLLHIGKWLRASASALARRDGAARGYTADRRELSAELAELSGRLQSTGLPRSAARLATAGRTLDDGGHPHLRDLPDPRVCRRCGHLVEDLAQDPCPTCGAHLLTYEHHAATYWLGEYGPFEIVDRLVANPDLFAAALAALERPAWGWIPNGHSWSATNVLEHVRDAQGVLAERAVLILDQDDPWLPHRPVFAWTDQRAGEAEDASAVLETYRASRAEMVERLRGAPASIWRRTGRHEGLGRVTLLQQASYFAAHELTHLRQLEELRRGWVTAGAGSTTPPRTAR